MKLSRASVFGICIFILFQTPTVAIGSGSFDMDQQIEIETSYFKTTYSQSGKPIGEDEFRESLDTLPAAEDLLDSASLYSNFGHATILGGPLMLIYGLTSLDSSPQKGELFAAMGAALTIGGVYLMRAASNHRKEAVEIYNRDRTEQKHTPRLWMNPLLSKNGNLGLSLTYTF